ncbi:MAG: hypothetical protein OEQ90_00245 [Gammaproteobacteria bacterium]|nr:hypothetical protein [Gammaproteobacteria bacterium]
MRYAASSLLASVLLLGAASAAEMRSVNVDYADGRYTMKSEVWFDATVQQVYDVFRQWDLSTQFSSTIVESADVEPDEEGRPQFYIRHKGCVWFFCLTFERRGYVESEPNEVLRAYANPETSDFLLSDETWTFAAENGGTVVSYHLLMKPKFWVPPGIGPYIIKRKLRNDGGDALDRIEVIAQAVKPGPGLD